MSDQGFPSSLRLLNAEEYRRVFDQTELKVHGKGLMALAVSNGLGHPRIGLVFSKKRVRRAVDRNRLKRLVRESIRLRQKHLPSVDIVILAKRGVTELDNAALHHQLHSMWQRLKRNNQKQLARTS